MGHVQGIGGSEKTVGEMGEMHGGDSRKCEPEKGTSQLEEPDNGGNGGPDRKTEVQTGDTGSGEAGKLSRLEGQHCKEPNTRIEPGYGDPQDDFRPDFPGRVQAHQDLREKIEGQLGIFAVINVLR